MNAPISKAEKERRSAQLWFNFYMNVLLVEREVNARSNVARADRLMSERIRKAMVELKGTFVPYPGSISFKDGTAYEIETEATMKYMRAAYPVKRAA